MLGVKPQIGRFFLPDEGQASGKPVIVISDSLWHRRFGGDPDILNQTVALDGNPYNIIGVLPAGIQFPFLAPADIWSSRYFEHSLFTPQRLRQGVGYLSIIARLRPGISRERAAAELTVLDQQFQKDNPGAPDAKPGMSMIVTDLQDSVVANIRGKLLILSIAGGRGAADRLCERGQPASLRALSRRKEIAVRAAWERGAASWSGQLLTESVLLALLGGLLGLGLSWAATKYFTTLADNASAPGNPHRHGRACASFYGGDLGSYRDPLRHLSCPAFFQDQRQPDFRAMKAAVRPEAIAAYSFEGCW